MKDQKKMDKKNEQTKEVEKIEIIDEKGYDIEQFLCRCSNKNIDRLD